MFGIFKQNPIKKLEKEHSKLLEEAMMIQRSGDLRAYADKIKEVEALEAKIAKLRS